MNRKHAGYLALWALMSGLACAQNAVTNTEAQLQGKTVFLKGGWEGNKLKFDGDGKPEAAYGALPFTESGFEEKSVSLKGTTLKIQGRRAGLEFDVKGKITLSDMGRMSIEIKGDAGTDFNRAVHEIFAPDLAALIPGLPVYWSYYAAQHFAAHPFPAAGASVAKKIDDHPPVSKPQSGGAVTAPKMLYAPDATFSQAAREAKYSGNVEVYFWLGEDGVPTHVRLIRPAGMGLDEEAIAAVLRYRFKPATKDGKPVKVDLYIDVNFAIL